MKTLRLLICFCFLPGAFAFQSEGVFPWVTNNANFRSNIILNNLGNDPVEVFLVATRNDGMEEGTSVVLEPLGQLVASAASLFPGLGEGAGYSVLVLCESELISGAFIVASQASASGSSPAQSDLAAPSSGSSHLLFNYLPNSGTGISAPVVVNLGEEDTDVVFHAYQNGQRVGSSEPIPLASGRPFADTTANLFPQAVGDLYVVAESGGALVGTAFIFNEFREPSMANAVPIGGLPQSEN